MKKIPPNINWDLTTLIATALGLLATDDFTALEQIAIGNWIVQIGQTVITTATYQQMIEARVIGSEKINLNSKEFKKGGSPFITRTNFDPAKVYEIFKSQVTEEEIINLQKALHLINQEIEKMKQEFRE